MSVPVEDLPDCEDDHECGNKGSIVVRSNTTGRYYHVCPDAWNTLNHDRCETLLKLA